MKVKLGKNKLHELALPASQPEQYLIAALQHDFGMHIWKYQMEYLKCKVQAKISLWKIIVSHWCLIVTSHQKNTKVEKLILILINPLFTHNSFKMQFWPWLCLNIAKWTRQNYTNFKWDQNPTFGACKSIF